MKPYLLSTGLDGRRVWQVSLDSGPGTAHANIIAQALGDLLSVLGYRDPERWEFLNLVFDAQTRCYSLILRDAYAPRHDDAE